MENVRSRRVVDNDDVAELPSEPAEVFDIVPSVENAGFSEEPRSKNPPLVQQVCHRISILEKPSTHTLPVSYKQMHESQCVGETVGKWIRTTLLEQDR